MRIEYSIMSEKFLLSYFPLYLQCKAQVNCSLPSTVQLHVHSET